MSPDKRFWSKVKKTDGCWLWTGHLDYQGYGDFTIGRKQRYRAHRYSVILDGRDPTGKYVCHHCDNPSCVRPDHLFIGTPLDNMQDKMKKGRHHMQRNNT